MLNEEAKVTRGNSACSYQVWGTPTKLWEQELKPCLSERHTYQTVCFLHSHVLTTAI
ncbi:hypothetical protein DPMN_181186 [Dreissena polymorpha]|uniref:Uncharacterized protein n=1 Tax=Dreissena polymorpha TaxID=45954 RepID=A0A9D4I3G9_DREPO|nr:hypothetical protein DPMN_181186 [Dreissena polymorpha]